jgi:hypothetical protein
MTASDVNLGARSPTASMLSPSHRALMADMRRCGRTAAPGLTTSPYVDDGV